MQLLSKSYGTDKSLCSAGTRYIEFLTRVHSDRGLTTTIKTAKAIRLYVTRFLSGQPLTTKISGIKLTKDYLPVILGPTLRGIARRGSTAEKRHLLTVLYSTRALTLPIQPNYENITAPNRSEKLDNIIADMASYSHGFWRSLGLRTKCPTENIS